MRRRKLAKWFLIFSGLLLVLLLVSNKQIRSQIMGGMEYRDVQINPGNMDVPIERTIEWKTNSVFADSICTMWAGKSIPCNLDGKGNYPRILLAKLKKKRDIPEVNKIIMKMKVWGVSGSSWALNKKGDYDFTITILTTILYQYGDQPELLYPETKDYLLNVLIFEGIQPASVLENILSSNPTRENLCNILQFLNGSKIEYDVNASRNLCYKIG